MNIDKFQYLYYKLHHSNKRIDHQQRILRMHHNMFQNNHMNIDKFQCFNYKLLHSNKQTDHQQRIQ